MLRNREKVLPADGYQLLCSTLLNDLFALSGRGQERLHIDPRYRIEIRRQGVLQIRSNIRRAATLNSRAWIIVAVLLLLMGFATGQARVNAGISVGKVQIHMDDNPVTSASMKAPPSGNEVAGNLWGERDLLTRAGISLHGSLVLEGFNNFMGGMRSGEVAGASTIDLSVGLDAKKLIGISGGKLYADLEDHAGQDPSNAIAGDLQVCDKLNSPPYFQLFELYYQQMLFDDRLRIMVGKVDANAQFSVIDYGLPFLNSSKQVTPTIIVFPDDTRPDAGYKYLLCTDAIDLSKFGSILREQVGQVRRFQRRTGVQPAERVWRAFYN